MKTAFFVYLCSDRFTFRGCLETNEVHLFRKSYFVVALVAMLVATPSIPISGIFGINSTPWFFAVFHVHVQHCAMFAAF